MLTQAPATFLFFSLFVGKHFVHSCHNSKNLNSEPTESPWAEVRSGGPMKKSQGMAADYGEKWILMPDGNNQPQFGVIRHINVDDFVPVDSIQYYYYSKHVPKGTLMHGDLKSFSPFNPRKKTKIIVHGWMASQEHSSVTTIVDVYVKHTDHNVIVCNWGVIADDVIYSRAAESTAQVGIALARFVDRLVDETDIPYSSIHIIGHSLGAHVASSAGKNTRTKVSRITCLDPAGPCFESWERCHFEEDSVALTTIEPTDAVLVDAIHTCVGAAGLVEPVGHVDFYPNGGSSLQPGCESNALEVVEQSCSHARSYEYFAESIYNDTFCSVKCSGWFDFKNNRCSSEKIKMGEHLSSHAQGVFYLQTRSSSPFSKGESGVVYES